MFDKLDFIVDKYDELSHLVSDPEVINNQPVWQKHVKEMGEMEPIVKKYTEYKKAKESMAEAKEMLEMGDEELRELAKMEISELLMMARSRYIMREILHKIKSESLGCYHLFSTFSAKPKRSLICRGVPSSSTTVPVNRPKT